VAICLLLLFSAPAFGVNWTEPRPTKREMLQKEVDEQPAPHVSSKPRYFLLFQSTNGFWVMSIFSQAASVSAKSLTPKSSNPAQTNGRDF
jgi:hypothetical protein